MQVKNFLAAAAVAALGFGAMGSAQAASPATAQFQVTLTVLAACTVATPADIALGSAPTGSAQNYGGNTTVAVTCPTGVPYTVGLVPSNNNTAGAGQLKSGSNTVAYNLYSDAAYSNAWGNTVGTNTKSGSGNGAAQNYTAYAQVKSAALASAVAGTYADTVTVNVNF